MGSDADPSQPAPERSSDEQRLDEIATALADAVDAVLPKWIESLVVERVRQWSGHCSPEIAAAAVAAGAAAAADVMPRLRALLATDIDDQTANPLEVLRGATGHATTALERAGVPTMTRDPFSERNFPQDHYGLVPASWADIDESLHELGLTWGAAKAFVFKARRRAEGRR